MYYKQDRYYKFLAYITISCGILFSIFPIWIGFLASTSSLQEILSGNIPMFRLGDEGFSNYQAILFSEIPSLKISAFKLFWNSIVFSLTVTFGKLIISVFSAYAIVFFRVPGEKFFFWLIFITLMLPVEVRLVPSFQLIVDLGLLNTDAGVVLPLIASATATFLLRQHFMTIPKEYIEAAIMDSASPWRFLVDILIPISKNTFIALFIITFIGAWHQYLWPLLINGDNTNNMVINIGLKYMLASSAEGVAPWHHILALSCIGLLPPMMLIFMLQKYYIAGLSNSEK